MPNLQIILPESIATTLSNRFVFQRYMKAVYGSQVDTKGYGTFVFCA